MILENYSNNITCMQQQDLKNLKIIGKRIRNIREEKFASLNKCAFEQEGITSATLSRIENGLVDFKFSTLLKLAYMLKTSPEDLVKGLYYNFNSEE